jgi:hypothetical protein
VLEGEVDVRAREHGQMTAHEDRPRPTGERSTERIVETPANAISPA